MTTPRSSTLTLIVATAKLAYDIESDDGIANAAIAEASNRLSDLRRLVNEAWSLVQAQHDTEHMLDGVKPKHRPHIDDLYARFKAEVSDK